MPYEREQLRVLQKQNEHVHTVWNNKTELCMFYKCFTSVSYPAFRQTVNLEVFAYIDLENAIEVTYVASHIHDPVSIFFKHL